MLGTCSGLSPELLMCQLLHCMLMFLAITDIVESFHLNLESEIIIGGI